MTDEPVPLAVGVEEAARLLTCSERQVWNLLRAGHLTRVKLGPKTTRVSIAELNAFIAAGGLSADNLGYPAADQAVA